MSVCVRLIQNHLEAKGRSRCNCLRRGVREEIRVVMSVSVDKLLFLQRAWREPVFVAIITLSSIFLFVCFIIIIICSMFFIYSLFKRR